MPPHRRFLGSTATVFLSYYMLPGKATFAELVSVTHIACYLKILELCFLFVIQHIILTI